MRLQILPVLSEISHFANITASLVANGEPQCVTLYSADRTLSSKLTMPCKGLYILKGQSCPLASYLQMTLG